MRSSWTIFFFILSHRDNIILREGESDGWHHRKRQSCRWIDRLSVVARCAGSSDAVIPLTSFYSLILHQNVQRWTSVLDYFWRFLETIMNRSSTWPNEWPAAYFAQQSSDVFLRATSSKSFHLKKGFCI